jgi:hypothetical protein
MWNGRLLSLALVAVTAMVTPAQADSLSIGQWVNLDDAPGANANGGGGAFILNAPGSGNSWISFCLEVTENINFSDNFYVGGIGNNAIGGGPGYGVGVGGDPLDQRTKAIYHKYRRNNTLGWTGAEVQYAIWFLEEEVLGQNNALVTWASANAASYDFGGDVVRVVNLLTGPRGRHAQDQLMLQDVPEPAALGLLTVVFGAVATARRRRPRA